MSASAKKILAAVAGLLGIAALVAYFVFIPQQEKKYEGAIAAFIDALPGDLTAESIRVDFLRNAAEIRGLRGNTAYIADSEMHVDIASVRLSGLNFGLEHKAGVNALADSLSAANGSIQTTMKMEGLDSPITQNIKFNSFEIQAIKGDFSAARREILSEETSLERKLDIAASFSAGPVRIRDYTTSTDMGAGLGSIETSMDSFEAKQYSLLSTQKAVLENMRISAMNMEFLALARLSLASFSMPNILLPLAENMENENVEVLGKAILGKIAQSPIVLRGLVLEGLRFQPMLPEAVNMKRWSMDVEASDKKLAVRQKVEGFVLPPSLYGPLSPETAQFSAFYKKALDIDLRLDAELTQKSGGGAEVALKDLFIQDKNLASAQIRADLLDATPMDSVYGLFDSGALALKKGELVLEDKALLENLLQAEITARGKGQRPEEQSSELIAMLREKSAQSLLEEAATESDAAKALAEGLARLIKEPGRLRIACNPAAPFALSLLDPSALEGLGATVEFSPAKEGEK